MRLRLCGMCWTKRITYKYLARDTSTDARKANKISRRLFKLQIHFHSNGLVPKTLVEQV
jgi:hypothetical protein